MNFINLKLTHLFYYIFNCLLLKSIINSILSSFAALFFLIFPHFLHLKMITYPFFPSISKLTGSKSPWHSSCLSPGFLSTCLECKQYGQWFLEEYPNLETFFPQLSQKYLVKNKTGATPYLFCAKYKDMNIVYEIQFALSLNFSYITNDNMVKEIDNVCPDSEIVFKFD